VSSKKTPCARSESGGNECGVWIAEEDPRHFGNGRDAGEHVSLSKTPHALLESRGDGYGCGSPEKASRARFRNGRDA